MDTRIIQVFKDFPCHSMQVMHCLSLNMQETEKRKMTGLTL